MSKALLRSSQPGSQQSHAQSVSSWNPPRYPWAKAHAGYDQNHNDAPNATTLGGTMAVGIPSVDPMRWFTDVAELTSNRLKTSARTFTLIGSKASVFSTRKSIIWIVGSRSILGSALTTSDGTCLPPVSSC